MSPDRSEEQVRAAYDLVAHEYAERLPGTQAEQPIDLAMLDHFITLLPTGRAEVLDAGCGTGRISRYLADRDCAVRGIDLSPEMVAMARRDHPDIPVTVASLTDIPFPDNSFDGVLAWYSVIHSPDSLLPAIVAEAGRVLRPEGLLLVAFQAGAGSRAVGQAYRDLGYDVTLTRYHRSPDEVAAVLSGAGFAEVARLTRQPCGREADPQAFVLGRLSAE